MAKKKGGGRRAAGGRRPIKGFRPGKEPPHLKKQRARAELGSDPTWAQKQAVEAVAGRSPREVEAMVRRWVVIASVLAAVLVVGGALLYPWSVVAGVIVHVLAAVVVFFVVRIRKHGSNLVEIAKAMR